MNETPAKVFSSDFCEIFKNTLLIERPQATAFKDTLKVFDDFKNKQKSGQSNVS